MINEKLEEYMNINCGELLFKLNEDDYSSLIFCNSKEELIEEFAKYINDNSIYFAEEDEEEDDLTLDDIKKKLIDETPIEWKGKGYYVMEGLVPEDYAIAPAIDYLSYELDCLDYFPFNVNVDVVYNTSSALKEWKKTKGYKHCYLVTFLRHVVIPHEYHPRYAVFSDKEMSESEIFNYMNDERDIFIGEFSALGSNYFVTEVESLDEDYFINSKESDCTKVYID